MTEDVNKLLNTLSTEPTAIITVLAWLGWTTAHLERVVVAAADRVVLEDHGGCSACRRKINGQIASHIKRADEQG